MFDLFTELTAIHRGVARDDGGTAPEDGSGTVSVRLVREYDADIDDVWDALTSPERVVRWLFPLSGDLRAGGDFQLEGHAGGDIRRCDRPSRLELTFGGPDSIVTVRLTATGDLTAVELVHTVPLALAGSGAGALFVGPGWDGALLGLGTHLRGEDAGDPLEAAGSPEMLKFNRGSIARWTEAVEASGTAGPDQLAGALEAAVAQYTTAPS